MSAHPELVIHVHGIDGHVSRFVQSDAAAARTILDQVHPARLFTQPSLIIKGDTATTAFPCSAIARIDLLTEAYPGWPFPRNLEDVIELSEAELAQHLRPEILRNWHPDHAVPGDPLLAFLDITLLNAAKVCAELVVCVPDATSIDRSILLHQILQAPVHYMRRRQGGAVLINPANIARFNLHPGPPVLAGAWPARLLDE